MSIVEYSIRKPVTVTVVVILVVIFGILGLLRVPVQLTPNVDQPIVTVSTGWFGASPAEIENEIVEEQEEQLKTVSGLRRMISQCVQGSGSIRLEFFTGVDKDAALNEVRDKLRQVSQYPPDVDEPVVEAVDRFSRDYIAWILLRPTGATTRPVLAANAAPGFSGDVTELQTFLEDEVQPLLERAEGVSEVGVLGGREREMQIRVDLSALAVRGITVDQFVEALKRENADATAGTITEGKRDVSVRAVSQYVSPKQIEQTVVTWTTDGSPVYVRDVAEVVQSFKKQVSFVRASGASVMALNAQRETGTNVLTVMANLKAAIEKANRDVIGPKGWGIELRQVYDQTVYVDRAVKGAADDLLLGAALAAVVLFLTLRSVGATLVVAVSIPISVIGTFLGMALTGRNLNVISMAGLSFAIGMGVDNTIVVLENIFRHREMGKDPFRAAIDGSQEVWGAIVAATLANIAVFLPVVFIREEAGQLFSDISIAISISLLLYMAVSPTVIPMLATLFLRKMPGGFVENKDGTTARTAANTRLGRLTQPLARAGAATSAGFYRMLLWLTHGFVRRLALVAIMVGGATWASFKLIPPQTYLPSGNQNLYFGVLSTPPGYSLDEIRTMGVQVESVLEPWWSVKDGSEEHRKRQWEWEEKRKTVLIPQMEGRLAGMKQMMPPEAFAEASLPVQRELAVLRGSKPPPAIDNFFFVGFEGSVFMGASSQDPENVESLQYLFQRSTAGIPGTFAFAFQMPIFRSDAFGSGIELNVRGNDIDQVRTAAGAMMGTIFQKFQRFPRPEPANFDVGRSETQLTPDRERAAAAGVATSTIRRIAKIAVDGEVIGDYRGEGRSIDLTVVAAQRPAGNAESLRDIPLATPTRQTVPLSGLVNFVATTAPQQINRIEEQPAVRLTVPVKTGETISELNAALEAQVIEPLRKAGVITPSLTIQMTGSADKLDQFQKAFIPGFILAAVITYLLLAALFESWLHPFVIIMSVPFALVGGFVGLAILHGTTGQTLDVLTMLGFVILIGTIVNNPILIVHQALNYMREGMEHNRAIALSAQTRVRPIFMSVVTSVAAMAPLVVVGGAGSELYRGLGAVVIGGLLVSTVFTLLLTPALMSLMLDLQDGVRRIFGRRRMQSAAPSAAPTERAMV